MSGRPSMQARLPAAHGTRRGESRYLIGIIVRNSIAIMRRRAPQPVNGGSHPGGPPMQESQEAASENGAANVLDEQELSRIDAYWRATNYLSVGQIYLLDNPLLQELLTPRLLKGLGLSYLLDWCADDQPFALNVPGIPTRSRSMTSRCASVRVSPAKNSTR